MYTKAEKLSTVWYARDVAALERKIGQLMTIALAGPELAAEERSLLRDCRFGGVILFARNCVAPRRMAALCRSLWEVTPAPPLVAVDAEGGRIHRLPQPFTHFPPAAALGRSGDPALAYRIGRAVADELKLVGVNLVFAPVLDVASHPANPIGDRAFGADAETVVRVALPWARGLRDGGVIPCAKHFPGHGGAAGDSHHELPAVTKTARELLRTDLRPFIQACREGVESLMTAHVLFPALDPKRPATLSRRVLGGLLRGRLGYRGVVFTDDLEMAAISDRYSREEAALLALSAGADVLLCCGDLLETAVLFEALARRAASDRTLRARVEESYRRVCVLKRKLSPPPGRFFERRLAGLPGRALAARLTADDRRCS
ncbi:MAG TPA: beta-N-acetylhexosaminidase [candidate division Zixibacteria bacterium]|nr:beta-N-acetylhexosaminidase [candidate division Zixibacteria bacterium]